MNPPTSGLSLVAHLIIIGLGKVVDLFRGRGNSTKISAPIKTKTESAQRAFVNYGVSFVIVTLLLGSMSLFLGIALRTSLREGENEWHRARAEEALLFAGVVSVDIFNEFGKVFSVAEAKGGELADFVFGNSSDSFTGMGTITK